jgi:uncharacterized SAM-binding protein YcdF (DUF218 family)
VEAFYLKKFISALLMPFTFFMILLLISFVLMYKKRKELGLNLFFFSILSLFLLSYQPVSNFLLHSLEDRFQKHERVDENISYIHVLGNGINSANFVPKTNLLNQTATLRVLEGVYQLKNHPNAKIIFSGYKAKERISSAKASFNFVTFMFDVPSKKIVMDDEAKDTIEEAMFCKKIASNKRVLLVTSATHMLRAVKIFKDNGVDVIAAPTDFLARDYSDYFDIFGVENLKNSTLVWHEYLGIAWLWVKESSLALKEWAVKMYEKFI